MRITVILCTYNRCEGLAQTLECVAASRVEDSVEWEVLVVDNNSTDRTPDVVEAFCRRRPDRFRYVFEPHPGKSFALNTGVRDARGDVLVFMDDDVKVEPTWLRSLTANLDSGNWAGAGGRTLLAEAFSPPEWMTTEGLDSVLGILAAVFDFGPEPGDLKFPPYGANMAFRREAFEKYGLFRTDLGPSPNRDIPRPNEDTEFGRRLMKAGERLRYEPSAIVYHPVMQNRVQKSYFLTWYYDYGRAHVREWGRGPDIFGVPRRCFTFFKLIGTVLPANALRWLLTRNPQRKFVSKCWVWVTIGAIREVYRQWHSGADPAIPFVQRSSEPADDDAYDTPY